MWNPNPSGILHINTHTHGTLTRIRCLGPHRKSTELYKTLRYLPPTRFIHPIPVDLLSAMRRRPLMRQLNDYDTGIGGSTTTISPMGSPLPTTYRSRRIAEGSGTAAAASSSPANGAANATAKTNGYYVQVNIMMDVAEGFAVQLVNVFCLPATGCIYVYTYFCSY